MEQEQFVSFKNLTHKGLANVVTHTTGTGMKADFTSPEGQRDWARYYAVSKVMRQNPVLARAALKIKVEREEKSNG